MSDRENVHALAELQEARSEVDRLRRAIEKHRQHMADYKPAGYDSELWAALSNKPLDGVDIVNFVTEIVMQLKETNKALEASAIQSNNEVLELMKSNENLIRENQKLKAKLDGKENNQ